LIDVRRPRSSAARAAATLLLLAALAAAQSLALRPGVAEAASLCGSPYALPPGLTFADAAGNPFPIDNPFFPLSPGTTYVYEATTRDGLERVTVRVTSQKRMIQGVAATIVRDEATLDGVLIERTFDWYAQDSAGNVWYLGEDSTEFPSGSKAGSWEWGVNGALPGLIMEAKPRVGDTYRQEYAPGEAEDAATVQSLTAQVSVPAGQFSDALQTRDFSCLFGGWEDKYYARGVGQVLTLEKGKTRLELIRKTGG
jgi:hypothetical protein